MNNDYRNNQWVMGRLLVEMGEPGAFPLINCQGAEGLDSLTSEECADFLHLADLYAVIEGMKSSDGVDHFQVLTGLNRADYTYPFRDSSNMTEFTASLVQALAEVGTNRFISPEQQLEVFNVLESVDVSGNVIPLLGRRDVRDDMAYLVGHGYSTILSPKVSVDVMQGYMGLLQPWSFLIDGDDIGKRQVGEFLDYNEKPHAEALEHFKEVVRAAKSIADDYFIADGARFSTEDKSGYVFLIAEGTIEESDSHINHYKDRLQGHVRAGDPESSANSVIESVLKDGTHQAMVFAANHIAKMWRLGKYDNALALIKDERDFFHGDTLSDNLGGVIANDIRCRNYPGLKRARELPRNLLNLDNTDMAPLKHALGYADQANELRHD